MKKFTILSLLIIASFLITASFVTADSLVVKKAVLPSGRSGLSCTEDSSTNKIYCFGGERPFTNQITEYDPPTDLLIVKKATLPSPSPHLRCVENSKTHKIYCLGGEIAGAQWTNRIIEYNPMTDNLIVKKAVLPYPRGVMGCAEDSSTNKIYCLGGFGGSNINQIIEYNPPTDTLTIKKATLPTARGSLSCAEDSNTHKIYCFGGTYINEIVEYNPSTDTLVVKKAILPSGRHWLDCAENSATHKIYCFGGEPNTDQITEYNPSTDTLKIKKAILPSKRRGLQCAEDHLTHKIYCLGGYDGNYLDQITEYTSTNLPPTLQPIPDTKGIEGKEIIITLQASDPENDPLIFSTNAATVLTSSFSFDKEKGIFKWTPTYVDYGQYKVIFSVSDGISTVKQTAKIFVEDAKTAKLVIIGTPKMDNTINIFIADPAAKNRHYIVVTALSDTPGFKLKDNRIVPATPDGLFWMSVLYPTQMGFTDSMGLLNSEGNGMAKWKITNHPFLKDKKVHLVLITMDINYNTPKSFISISDSTTLTIKA